MNKVILMGRLTRDPEMRFTSSNNTPVCSFTLAVDRRFSRQGEERQADFIPIVVWSKQAEFCNNYFRKGSKVVVVGRIQTRSWDDTEGKKHYVTEVVAEELYFAESKRDNAESFVPKAAAPSNDDGFYTNNNFDDNDDLPF